MKFEHLVRIAERFQYEITCPQCQELFSLKNLEILGVKDEFATFQIKCEHCGAMSNLAAEIGNPTQISAGKTKSKNNSAPKKHKISESDVENIMKSLKNFSGKDINDFFKE